MAHLTAVSGLTGPAKLKTVSDLMHKLTQDLDTKSLTSQQRNAALEEVKVLGRDAKDADPIFTRDGITTLTRHAFDSTCDTTSRNALRVLCNTLLITPETRQMFVDLGYEDKACAKLANHDGDDEFLVSRILFLTTYGTNVNLLTLIDHHSLADHVVRHLARHAARLTDVEREAEAEPMEVMALGETLKLVFNITHFCPQRTASFTPAIPHMLRLLCSLDFSATAPLATPMGPLVNALLNLDLDHKDVYSALYPAHEPTSVSVPDRLISLLDASLKAYDDGELEATATPLVGVTRRVYSSAPGPVQTLMRGRLLPTDAERRTVLGRGESLSARLLRNTTNALAPELRDALANLVFDMSDRNAETLVRNVGYGFASGFLFQNRLAVPAAVLDPSGTRGTATEDGERPVNAVTGQFLEAEAESAPSGLEVHMTQEEKEREAERLFVLFERLQRTGIVDVQNPIARAVKEGRFEDLSDDQESS